MADVPVSMEFDSAWLAPSGVLDERYEIQRVLGRGGAAIVLLARDKRYARDVAIKVLKPELAGVIASARFLQEIQITASLQHPHVLPLLDSGESRGLPYYVAPYVAGGSLRDRLNEARQLPLDEALGIAADVSSALQGAHEHGVIHRDIKPENILLSGGHALVADFGLAQALVRSGGDRLTSSGIIVGTPAYISPEQASGERTLGPTTDIYSFACVVYEMLAGVPPFVGPTAESVIAQRFRGPPHPVRHYRPNIPEHVDRAVMRGMCSAAADRFQSAKEFATALGVARGTPNAIAAINEPSRRRGVPKALVAIAVLVPLVSAATWGIRLLADRALNTPLDETRYVVLPVTGDGGRIGGSEAAMRHIAAAMHRWRDIQVVEFPNSPPLSARDAPSDVARRQGAGSYLTTSIIGFGDSLEVRSALWKTPARTPVIERTVRIHKDSVDGDGPWRRLVGTLLAADSSIADENLLNEIPGTSSLKAWRAYALGQEARANWNLGRAEAHYSDAVAADPNFAQAQLWLAQVAAWVHPDQPATWRDAAARALDLARGLTRRDSLLAAGVNALGVGNFPASCSAYRATRDLDSADPVPWLGIAQCEAVDGLVMRDSKSPSGWRFRTSWRSAAAAYDSALRRVTGAPTFAYQWYARILLVDPTWSRDGYEINGAVFRSYPTLEHDTLAHIPFPTAVFEAGATKLDRSAIAAALRRNARHIDTAYVEWTRRAPASPDAWEALSFIQEITGEAAAEEGGGLLALRSNTTARRLTRDSSQALRLVQAAVRLLAKTEQFAAANRLADSVLRAIPKADGAQAVRIAGIAALIGRVERTTELLRAKARARPQDVFAGPPPPPAISDVGTTYQTVAALGVCSDALRQARVDVERALDRYATADSRDIIRQTVVSRAASLSVPCLGPHAVDSTVSPDPLVAMQKAVAANDVKAFRAQLASLDRDRRFNRPGDIAPDHIYQEAWLLAAVRDTAAAIRRLDLSLTALTTLNTHLLEDIPKAAALGRAMILRADLAAARSDGPTARRWAKDVLELWAGASPALATDVTRMQRYTSTQH